jgi:hypothetical protein
MADWFKFYENDLDETRLQYAIAKLPEVVSVWVGILSECCRHKSGTIRWGDNEIELFGFSRRLGISLPKVNQGINLLCEIDYIVKKNGHISVIKWGSKQSEYCQKLSAKKNSPESVPTLSRECRPRGEEKRGDKKRISISPAPASESPNHAAFIKGWCDNFEAKFKTKYAFNGGQDGKSVKQLLGLGVTIIDLLEIAKKSWDDPDITQYRSAASISGFSKNFNQIQVELKNGNKTSRRNSENPRNAGVCIAGPSIADQVALKIQRQNDRSG